MNSYSAYLVQLFKVYPGIVCLFHLSAQHAALPQLDLFNSIKC